MEVNRTNNLARVEETEKLYEGKEDSVEASTRRKKMVYIDGNAKRNSDERPRTLRTEIQVAWPEQEVE